MIRKGALCVWVIVFLFSAGGIDAGDGAKLGSLEIPASAEKDRAAKWAPLYASLDSGLNRILTESDPFKTAESLGYRVRDGRVQIVAVTIEESTDDVMGWLASRDALHISSAGDLVQAFVPVHVVYELEGHPLVKFVRKPLYIDRGPEPDPSAKSKMLTYTSEGVAAMNAAAWHNNGLTGQGVKLGIVDRGFEGVNSLLGTDLPGSSYVTGMSFGGTVFEGEAHGTACAEIVHDVAPGLTGLYLAATTTGVDMVNAIAWLADEGVDIISMSLGFSLLGGPGDGTGYLADVIDAYVASGGIFVVSAGNEADSHWQGRWSDDDSDGWINFTAAGEINTITNFSRTEKLWIPSDIDLSATLIWNQWSSPPTTDLDFCFYQWDDETDPTIVECSEDQQNGQSGQLPVEQLSYTTVQPGYYGVSIKLYSGSSNVDIELEIDDAPVQYVVEAGSLSLPADTASAISVGAIDVGTYAIEYYSSRGPTNGPGGALTGGFTKPDISGFANVSTATYGPRSGSDPFNGTSAACPHVAGAAALVWSANPSWTNAQVRSFLETKALDKGPSGKDNTYGHGRLTLGAAPATCSYSLSPSSRSFASSGGSGSFSVSASSGCGWNATTAQAWIHITGGSSGSGNGTVSFTVATRSSTNDRSGTINVAGKTFTITQSGASSCTYSISPSSRSHVASGGTGSISVTSGAGCSWSASSSRSWITVTGGSSGSGNGTVSYSVSNNTSSSSRSGSITIGGKAFTVSQSGSGGSPASGDFTYFAVVAHTTGSNNSVWQSTLSACNVSSSNAAVVLTYRYGSSSVSRNVVIPPYGLAEWTDAPVDLFGVGGKSSGVVTIDSDARLLVAVRTFNSSVDGTFGQSLPGVSSSVSMTSSQFGMISPVRRTTQFRTNIGVINTGNRSCVVEVVFGDTNGFIIGDTITINLAAGEWKQINEALKKAGISRANAAIALVQVRTAGAEVWAYGTVIDNSSGDPTALGVAIFD